MIDKKRYYKLDDIGFIGTQKKNQHFKKREKPLKPVKLSVAERARLPEKNQL